MKISHLDYEGRSGVDITEVGSHRWSIDKRFELLMAAVSRDGDPRVYLWINPKFRTPDEMGENEEAERILEEADIVFAHNATNELANTWGALEQGKACPVKSWEKLLPKLRDTAAMARKAGLPHALDKLCTTLNVKDSKDRAGKALIQFFCIPDEETGLFNEPRDHPEKWAQFCDYCRQDVRAETECGQKLKAFELTGAALATFQFDLRMNQRGIPINVAAARNAQKIIDSVQAGVKEEFRALTGLNPTQGKKFKVWLASRDVEMPNLQAPTVEEWLEKLAKAAGSEDGERYSIMGEAHRALEMFQAVSYAAVKKIQTMIDCVCPDGRVRGAHMYYGAGPGRWSGKLLQPQNFKRISPEMRPYTHMFYAAVIRGMTAEMADDLFGSPLDFLSSCIRHFIHHPVHSMLDGDYSGIEARIIAWSAGQEDVLQEWRDADEGTGLGPYRYMAAEVYGVSPDKVTKDQREVGKRIILGAGYQMGWKKFKSSCLQQYQLDLPKELCQKGIKAFRKKCSKIRDYWWHLNRSAIEAIKTSSSSGPFTVRRVAGISYLLFQLPSGRSIAYPWPEVNLVQWVPEPDEEFEAAMDAREKAADAIPLPEGYSTIRVRDTEVKWREEITYWGQLPMSAQWGRVKLYGGKLAENRTQGIAADFMAHGALNAERLGMPPFMLVHDQGLALQDNGQTEEAFSAALADLPSWANGFPMKVEAGVTPYFTKE